MIGLIGWHGVREFTRDGLKGLHSDNHMGWRA